MSCLPKDMSISPAPSASPSAQNAGSFIGITSAQTVGPTKVLLSWTPSDNPDVTVYNVYDVSIVFMPKLIKTVRAPASSTTLTGLGNQSFYTFRVRAADINGKEDTNTADVSAIPYGGIVSAVVQTSTTAAITYEDGSNADGIYIYCKTDADPNFVLMKKVTNVSLTSVTLTDLVPGKEYTCRTALGISGFEDNNAVTVSFIPMGSASKLVFAPQPSSAAAGVTLGVQPVIKIMDDNGNVVSVGPDSNAIISLSVATASPTLGTVRGNASVQAVKGVATFSGIFFQESGEKILTANKPDNSGVTFGTGVLTTDSDPFTITPGPVSKDKTTIALSPSGTLVANGTAAFTVTINLQDQFGNLISGIKPIFTSSNSLDSLTQSPIVSPASGTVTGSIASTVAGTRTLSISSPSGLADVTASATFVPGTATKVAFLQQPGNSPAGPSGVNSIQVAIQDAQGNTVNTGTSSTADVTLSIFVNPGGSSLSGTTTVAAVNGVATFTGLGLDKTGTGYKLVANSPPLGLAYSNAFNVTSGVPSKIAISGPSSVLSGACSTAYTIQLQDWAGNPANAPANTPIVLSGLGSGGAVYTSSACAGSPIAGSINFASGSNLKTVYLKDNKGEALTFTATDPSSVMSAGTKSIQILPSQISLTGPSSVIAGQCSQALMITTQGADNTSGNVYTNTSVQIAGLLGSQGSLYSDPACSGSALDPANITLAANTNLTNIYFKDNKSETLSLSVVDPASIMTTSTGAITLPVLPSNIDFTGPTSVVSGLCSTVFTIKIKDAANNDVPVAADTTLTINGTGGTSGAFYANSSCTGGTLGTSVVISQNSSYTTIYFKDTAAETLSLSISDPAAQLAISQTINLGVSPSALALTGPSPATVATSVCSSAFTITTKDGAGTTTAAITPITVNLSGAGSGGAFYSDSSCTTPVTQFTFATGDSNKQFYLMSLSPATSPQLTLTVSDAASILSSGSMNFAITAAPAWIGTSGTMSWFQTGKVPVAARLDAPSSIYGLHFDDTKQYLYLTDYQSHRVLKYDYTNQQYIGWVGGYEANGQIGATGSVVNGTINSQCIMMNTDNTPTPGWCQGGQALANSNNTRGNMWNPAGVTDDGTSIYVTQWNGYTITKYDAATGTFQGWIGRVNSTPTGPGTGLSNSCNSTTAGNPTPGWCIGGGNANANGGTGAIANKGDGGIVRPRAIIFADPYLYVTSNGGIFRYNANTGAFMGWIGMVSTTSPSGPAPDVSNTCSSKGNNQLTPGWCMDGTNQNVNPTTGGFNSPTGLYADTVNDILYVADQWNSTYTINKYQLSTGAYLSALLTTNMVSPFQLVSDGPNIYVADWTRILRLDTSGNITGWIGKVSNPPVAGNAGCNTLVTNANTPGWCLGGSAKHGMDETAVHQLSAIELDASGNILTGQYANFPVVKKWNATTGAHMGSMSLVTNSPTKWSVESDFAGFYGFDDNSFIYPTGMAVNSGKLYVADWGGRIKKIETATGQVLGWIGGVTTSPTGGDPGCAGASPMSLTPGWCLGALPNPWYIWNSIIPQASDGLMNQPAGMTTDGTYLYVVDVAWHRIQKFQISDGSYLGWIGGIGSNPLPATCTGVAGQFSGSGWCKGGTPSAGSADGYLNGPSAIYHNGGYLYVIDRANHRISKYNANTGAFAGWIGRVNSGVTLPSSGCTPASKGGYLYSGTGWCIGGTPQGSIQGADPGGGFLFNSRPSITGDGTFLYISNELNSRIDKFNISTGAFVGATNSRWDQYVNTWTNNPTTWGWIDYRPFAVWTDGTHLYGSGSGLAIWKMSLSTGSMIGFRTAIPGGNPPNGGDSGCVGATSYSPGWCRGGGWTQGYTMGKFTGAARYITGDADFIYVSDENSHRVTRLPK